MAEQWAFNPLVQGSTPWRPTRQNTSRSRDFRYLASGHRTPGARASVVVTRDPMNGMKTDLTEEQFMALVAALARVFTGGTFDERAFPDGMTPGSGRCRVP